MATDSATTLLVLTWPGRATNEFLIGLQVGPKVWFGPSTSIGI